uniref:ABC transporter permease subunit n=1 Tax=Halorientalis sp. TaxID=1931229 RepID=UPI0039C8B0FE
TSLLGVDVDGSVTLPVLGSVLRWRLAIVLITFLVIGATYYVVERTDFGLVVQAGTEDSEMVRLMGIKITRSYALIFGLGAALAGLAGLIGGSIINPEPGIGTQEALVPAFLTVVVGGAGSVIGAIVGGLMLGMIVGFFEITAAAWSQIALYAFVAVFILVRPEGLFGSTEVGT